LTTIFRNLDPAHRTIHGEPTAGAAIAACKVIVECSLIEQCEQGMTVDQLFGAFQLFGDAPFAVPDVGFSAWDYAKARARELTA